MRKKKLKKMDGTIEKPLIVLTRKSGKTQHLYHTQSSLRCKETSIPYKHRDPHHDLPREVPHARWHKGWVAGMVVGAGSRRLGNPGTYLLWAEKSSGEALGTPAHPVIMRTDGKETATLLSPEPFLLVQIRVQR